MAVGTIVVSKLQQNNAETKFFKRDDNEKMWRTFFLFKQAFAHIRPVKRKTKFSGSNIAKKKAKREKPEKVKNNVLLKI